MVFSATPNTTLDESSGFLPRIGRNKKNGNGAKAELLRLLEQVGSPLQPLAEKMIDYSKAELQAIVEARLNKKDQARLSKLSEVHRERALTENEKAEVEILLDKSAALTMNSAAARWLLAHG